MRLLAIETATDACSIALMHDDEIIADAALYRPRQHAAHLAPLIVSTLDRVEWHPSDVDVFAVSSGPGSYTGLRIGVSTAKGFAMAAAASVVAVPTLEAFALQALSHMSVGDIVVTLFDARRDSVYASAWRRGVDGTFEEIIPVSVLEVAEVERMLHALDGRIHLMGDGANLVERPPHAVMHDDLRPHASAIASLGKQLFDRGETTDLATFEPDYMREFVAKTPTRSAFAKLGF